MINKPKPRINAADSSSPALLPSQTVPGQWHSPAVTMPPTARVLGPPGPAARAPAQTGHRRITFAVTRPGRRGPGPQAAWARTRAEANNRDHGEKSIGDVAASRLPVAATAARRRDGARATMCRACPGSTPSRSRSSSRSSATACMGPRTVRRQRGRGTGRSAGPRARHRGGAGFRRNELRAARTGEADVDWEAARRPGPGSRGVSRPQ